VIGGKTDSRRLASRVIILVTDSVVNSSSVFVFKILITVTQFVGIALINICANCLSVNHALSSSVLSRSSLTLVRKSVSYAGIGLDSSITNFKSSLFNVNERGVFYLGTWNPIYLRRI